MQLDHAEEYRTLADGNSIKIRLLPPSRGLILDRNGIIIAGNEQNYRVTLTREEAGGDVKACCAPVAAGAHDRRPHGRADGRVFPPQRHHPHRTGRPPDLGAVQRHRGQRPSLPGVTPESALSRAYPRAGDFAHVMGYVGPVSDYDLSRIEDLTRSCCCRISAGQDRGRGPHGGDPARQGGRPPRRGQRPRARDSPAVAPAGRTGGHAAADAGCRLAELCRAADGHRKRRRRHHRLPDRRAADDLFVAQLRSNKFVRGISSPNTAR